MPSFPDQLDAAIRQRKTPVLVGLDPQLDLLPEGLAPRQDGECPFTQSAAAFSQFCRGVIDVVAPLVAVVKPQAAFFEQLGPAGMTALGEVIHYAQSKGLLVILDGKRNDIGSTATAYARGILGRGVNPWGADAITVNPYLGDDSLKPFVDVAVEREAGVFVLVKTSNPGGKMFQDLVSEGRPLYEHVGAFVEQLARQTAGSCGYGAVGGRWGNLPRATGPPPRGMPTLSCARLWSREQRGTWRLRYERRRSRVNNSRGSSSPIARFSERSARWLKAVEAATLDMMEQLRTSAGSSASSTRPLYAESPPPGVTAFPNAHVSMLGSRLGSFRVPITKQERSVDVVRANTTLSRHP